MSLASTCNQGHLFASVRGMPARIFSALQTTKSSEVGTPLQRIAKPEASCSGTVFMAPRSVHEILTYIADRMIIISIKEGSLKV